MTCHTSRCHSLIRVITAPTPCRWSLRVRRMLGCNKPLPLSPRGLVRRSGWRGQNFPVLYNQLPDRNAIVFATNDKRPDFLRDHPAVKAPVIEMINHPQNPYVKLLVVFGRDDKDLLQAAKGIAQGNILFRGESVVVNEVKTAATA